MKRRRKKARPAAPAFAGLTAADCCTACTRAQCTISAKPYCGHPRKGGLRPDEMHNAKAFARFSAAERQIEPVHDWRQLFQSR
jgi:hypothetical protein